MLLKLTCQVIYGFNMKSAESFFTGYFYHIYNHSIDSLTPFLNDFYSGRFLNLAWYYRSTKCQVSYSCYENAPAELKNQWEKDINNPQYFQVEILAFCLMPNHYHFLLRQNIKGGISQFMNNIINAITRYYNVLNSRKGPIFIPQYKSQLIHTEEQLIHASRYIHLNPYSAGIVKSFKELFNYRFSSLREYLSSPKLVNTSLILNTGYFLGNKEKYKSFITNHADYQRTLEQIKYLEKWR